MPPILNAFQTSYVAKSLRQAETHLAAGIVLAVTLLVVALSRVPLNEGIVVDFCENDRSDGTAQATPSGLSLATAEGRSNVGPHVTVVTNRPLPRRFALFIDGKWRSPGASGAVQIRVGNSRKQVTFGAAESLQAVGFENPDGTRDIELEVEPGKTFSVRRLTVTVDEADALLR